MAELSEIREAIAALLRPLVEGQVSPYLLSNPTPPCAQIVPAEVDYDKAAGRGMDRWELIVQVLVSSAATDIGAQKRLDRFMAPAGGESIKEALEGTSGEPQTLGGLIQDLRVTRAEGYREYIVGSARTPMLGSEWRVDVYARGD